MTLSADTRIDSRENVRVAGPAAASVTIYHHALVVMDTSGNFRPGRASTTDRAVGRAMFKVDNSAGAAGALTVEVEKGVFRFKNSTAGDAITLAAHLNALVYVVDDETVAATSNSNARVVAGRVVDVDSTGVWVAVGDSASGGDVYSGTYSPAFTSGTNTTGSGTALGSFTRIGKTVSFSVVVPSVVCTLGAPTASSFELALPIASNFAATTDLTGTVTGANLTSGRASGSVANDRAVVNFSCTSAASNDVIVSGHYQII